MHTIFWIAVLLQSLCTKRADFSQFDPKTTTVLDLSNKGITSIEGIGQFVNLEHLNLSENKLKELPPEIGNLRSLKALDLSKNEITKLPSEIGNLFRARLNLRGNPIAKTGDGETTVGEEELRRSFKDYVMFDQDAVNPEQNEISKGNVYDELKNKPIRWNFHELRKLRVSIPESNHTEDDLVEIWRSVSKCTTEENQKIIKDFIHHIYNPMENYERWKIIDPDSCEDPDNHLSVVLAKNLIGCIVDKISDRISDHIVDIYMDILAREVKGCNESNPAPITEKNDMAGNELDDIAETCDDQAIMDSINMICMGLYHDPDNYIRKMMVAYRILIGDLKENSLDSFVRSVIAREKEKIFEDVVAQTETGKNLYILNVLTNKMAEEIGLNKTIETSLGRKNKDRFNGCIEDILRKFYSVFTPDYIFKVVKDHINARDDMISNTLETINNNRIEEPREKAQKEDYDAFEDGQKDYTDLTLNNEIRVTEKFVEKYLMEIRIVESSYLKRKGSEDADLPLKRMKSDQSPSGH